MKMVRFFQFSAAFMFVFAFAFFGFFLESVVWYGRVFTLAMAALSVAVGVVDLAAVKHEKEYMRREG